MDVSAIGRSLTRAQIFLLLHGDHLLHELALSGAPPKPPPPADTSRMSKTEYLEFLRAQMEGTVKWH